MWKIVTSIIVVFTCLQFVSGQNLPQSHYKFKAANEVLQSIGSATGNIRTIPSLRLSRLDNFVAEYDPHTIEIVVSESFYDLCTGFGKDSLNALACILGHELGHYYLNHAYSGGFNEILGSKKQTDITLEYKKIMEAKADIFGLKYAYLAGFDSYQVMSNVLEKIYQRYTVSSSPGYPTKRQRVAIAQDQVVQLKPLIYIFETALFLHVKQNFREAALLYDYLLKKDLVSSGILTNLGAIYLEQALSLSDENARTDLFLYPCEISPGERLRNLLNHRGMSSADKSNRDHYLQLAKKYLNQAIEIDKNTSAPYLNLATIQLISENYNAAHGYLDDLQKQCIKSEKVLPPNYYLLRGIAFTLQENFNKANTYLNMAKSKNAYEIEANISFFNYHRGSYKNVMKDFLDSKLRFVQTYLETENNKKSEKITFPVFDLSDGDFSLKGMQDIHFEQKVSNAMINEPFYLNYNDNDAGLLKAKLEFSDKTLYFIRANQEYQQKTPAGVMIGDSFHILEDLHGPGDDEYRFSNGARYVLYWKKEISNTGLMVETKNNKVVSMLFFTVN